MPIFNLGSINIDNFYYLTRLPGPGETTSTKRHGSQLGGKGANQSVAACLAGSEVRHIGAVGADGAWCRRALESAGVDVRYVETVDVATGHANICIDQQGENMIVVMPGANHALNWPLVQEALEEMSSQDILIAQNETTLVCRAAKIAHERGAKVIYSAAPFDAQAVQEVLPFCDLLVMNEVEAAQLSKALGIASDQIDVAHVLITKGAKGAIWRDQKTGQKIAVPADKVDPVDSTGAGDCFIGYVAAGIDMGLPLDHTLRRAVAASALQVTREGTAAVMPTAQEVMAFIDARD